MGFFLMIQIQIIDSWVLANQDSTVEVKYRGANEEQQKSADFLFDSLAVSYVSNVDYVNNPIPMVFTNLD